MSGFIDLAQGAADPLHLQIARQIKAAVLSGKLPPQSRVPSSRLLADELGVSRNTVITALDQLKAEGYLESVPGSAVRVAGVPVSDLARAKSGDGKRQFAHRLAARWEKAIAEHPTAPMDTPRAFRPGVVSPWHCERPAANPKSPSNPGMLP